MNEKLLNARIQKLAKICDYIALASNQAEQKGRIPRTTIRRVDDYKLFLIAIANDDILGGIAKGMLRVISAFKSAAEEFNEGNPVEDLLNEVERRMDDVSKLMEEVRINGI